MKEIVVVDGDLFSRRYMPERIFNALQLDSQTGDLRWTGPTKQSMGRRRNLSWPSSRQPYGIIPWKAELEWLKAHGYCRPEATVAMAHVAVFQCYHGPLPPDWTVDHREGNCPLRHPLCCHPDHLEAVPLSVNSRRAVDANCRPIELYPRLFDVQRFDGHVPPDGNLTRVILPGTKPFYRATRVASAVRAA